MSAIACDSRPSQDQADVNISKSPTRVAAVSRSPCGLPEPETGAAVLTVVLEPGQCLYHAGERPDAGYVVKSGLLRQVMQLADGRRQILRFIFPDDILDWTDTADMPFSAEAVEHAEVRCFSKAQLETVLSRNAAARTKWKRLAEQHFHDMQRHAVVLGRLSSTERLAYFLIWLQQHTADSADGVLHVPMVRGDIADYLGLTVETVSRSFAVLRDSGLIELVSSRDVQVIKPAALRAMARHVWNAPRLNPSNPAVFREDYSLTL